MKYKATWYPVDGSEPNEVMYNSLEEVAASITSNPQWENNGRGYYIDWVDDGTLAEE